MQRAALIDVHQHPVPDHYKRALAAVGVAGSGENPWPEWSLEGQAYGSREVPSSR